MKLFSLSLQQCLVRWSMVLVVVIASIALTSQPAQASHTVENHCISPSSGVDLNVLFGVTKQIVTPFCNQVDSGEGWTAAGPAWLMSTSFDIAPDGFVPAGITPLEDFIAKFVGIRYVIDPGTRQEKVLFYPNNDNLWTGTIAGLPAVWPGTLSKLPPLSIGEHFITDDPSDRPAVLGCDWRLQQQSVSAGDDLADPATPDNGVAATHQEAVARVGFRRRIVAAGGAAMAKFDSRVVDGGVNGTGWLTRVTSTISMWWDTWIIDGAVRLSSFIVKISSYPVRILQTGYVQAYALVFVAGVLAFSVSARTREFGVRLAIGSTPAHLLIRVLREGAAIGIGGIVAGAIGGMLVSRIVGSFVPDVQMPGLAPIAGAAFVLVVAAIVASVMPAARASRVDVVCALRAE